MEKTMGEGEGAGMGRGKRNGQKRGKERKGKVAEEKRRGRVNGGRRRSRNKKGEGTWEEKGKDGASVEREERTRKEKKGLESIFYTHQRSSTRNNERGWTWEKPRKHIGKRNMNVTETKKG